ncbi:hypothetical protein JQ604_40930 [Bradyrhizobium jicamae]|uniref:hypothetical protein n=1 Tax=Bradyrhizobium jicamae TaxID=280332 RepID=UPI001BA80767|nr:hypothetical protein [Bradyrhizobium jicamae]MBR0758585.1 hypothetical protein [Bradyrhizobium jicamae]
MPIGRYFLIMGGVLLALLFLADWSMPTVTATPEEASNEHPTILIHSRRRGPDAVVFDTSRPTIVPPTPATVAAEAPSETSLQDAKPPTDAMAMAEPAAPVEQAAPAPPKRAAERRRPRPHREARRDDARRIASYDMFANRQPFIFGGW